MLAWITCLVLIGMVPGPHVSAAPAGLHGTALVQQVAPQPDTLQQQPGTSLANRLADATLATQIKLELVKDDALRLFDFEPAVAGGIVTLNGIVRTLEQVRHAGEVAQRVPGVRQVVNRVETTEGETLPLLPADRPAQQTPAATQPERQQPAPGPAQYHTVRSGESLWTIARQYNTTTDHIRRMNNLRTDSIRPGQRLKVRE